MKIRSTIFVLVLALLGVAAMAYVGFNESARTLRPQSIQRLLSADQLPVEAVTRITLRRAEETELVFEREGGRWNQVKPFAHPMDPFSIRQFAVLARELQSVDTLDPKDLETGAAPKSGSSGPSGGKAVQSLASLRLAPPEAEIIYEWPGGSLKLDLGRRSVAGRAYLRIAGQPAVHIVNYELHERAVSMNPKEWRDRTIFRDISPELSRIAWQQQGAGDANRVTLERAGRLWTMTEPVKTRVDAHARDAYLQALEIAKLGGFVLDQPSDQDLTRFGLSNPLATLTVTGAHEQRLLIGSRAGGAANTGAQDFFGMIEGRPVVVRITAPVIAALFRGAQHLVEPTGSGVQPADVKSIVIRGKDGEFRLERELERWLAPAPAPAPAPGGAGGGARDVNPAHVQELLDQLTQLRAPAIELRPYPHEQEVATITLYGYDARALDTVRIAQDKQTDRWVLENGDNVLRIFPAGLKLRLTAGDFGL
jgi:hypothetical protein